MHTVLYAGYVCYFPFILPFFFSCSPSAFLLITHGVTSVTTFNQIKNEFAKFVRESLKGNEFGTM